MTKFFASLAIFISTLLISNIACAEDVVKNTAQMQAMDKITGRVSVINVPVGGEVKFGSLSIVVRKCQTRPVEETPDNFAFVDISDTTLQGDEFNIFKGWMISSSPATHAVEHPIYDVWLLKCRDSQIDKKQLLSEEQLAARDNLPMQRNEDSAKIATQNTDSQTTLMEMKAPEEPEQTTQPPEMETTEFLYDEEDENEEINEEEEEENAESTENVTASEDTSTNSEDKNTVNTVPDNTL